MHLEFKGRVTLELLREYFERGVKALRPDWSGSWREVQRTPLPHPHHGALPVLAETLYELGEATLRQVVSGDEGGNPRDGYGFTVELRLRVPTSSGTPRELRVSFANWEPQATSVHLSLNGATPREFVTLRALGRELFATDTSSAATWARENIDEVLAAGDRALARELATETLAGTEPAFAMHSRRAIRKTYLQLLDDPAAQLRERAIALEETITDVEALLLVKTGALALPGWTPSRAANVLARMQPWDSEAMELLLPLSSAWSATPWTRTEREPGWLSVRRRKGAEFVEPTLAELLNGLVPRAGVDSVYVAGLREEQDVLREGSLTPQGVRGMVHRRVRGPQTHVHWTWLWKGQLDGVLLVTEQRAGVDLQQPSPKLWMLFFGDTADLETVLRDSVSWFEFASARSAT